MIDGVSLTTFGQKMTKFTVTIDESIYIFPADSLFRIKIKANSVSEAHITSDILIVYRNVSKVSTMSGNIICDRNIENKAKIMSENINIEGNINEQIKIMSENIKCNNKKFCKS
jgi:hypothetical protein